MVSGFFIVILNLGRANTARVNMPGAWLRLSRSTV